MHEILADATENFSFPASAPRLGMTGCLRVFRAQRLQMPGSFSTPLPLFAQIGDTPDEPLQAGLHSDRWYGLKSTSWRRYKRRWLFSASGLLSMWAAARRMPWRVWEAVFTSGEICGEGGKAAVYKGISIARYFLTSTAVLCNGPQTLKRRFHVRETA